MTSKIVAVGRLAQGGRVERRRLGEAALDDHALAVADAAVTGGAVDVVAVPAVLDERAIDLHGDRLHVLTARLAGVIGGIGAERRRGRPCRAPGGGRPGRPRRTCWSPAARNAAGRTWHRGSPWRRPRPGTPPAQRPHQGGGEARWHGVVESGLSGWHPSGVLSVRPRKRLSVAGSPGTPSSPPGRTAGRCSGCRGRSGCATPGRTRAR